MTSREGIVSSTGNPGLQLRSYNRIYCNWTADPIKQASTIIGMFNRLAQIGQIEKGGTSVEPYGRREVFRGLVPSHVVSDLVAMEQPGGPTVEVAFPITDHLWYLGMAQNHVSRRALRPAQEMHAKARENIRQFNPPLATIEKILSEGHTFITSINPKDKKTARELFSLWHTTFGWDKEQIATFISNLNMQDKENPHYWFTGIRDKTGTLRAAAMAELIEFSDGKGNIVRVVETTEWSSTESDHIKGVADHLHSQVLENYSDAHIIGEFNEYRGAHRAAQKSGMVSPYIVINNRVIYQALEQNVSVGDGNLPEGLRDFLVHVLPSDALSPQTRREILARTNTLVYA